jgi:hypothetical protein
MKKTRYTGLLVASVVLLSATTAMRAGAQEIEDQSMGPSRVSIEPFLSHIFFDNPVGDNDGLGGIGVRAMVGRGAVVGGMNTFFTRARAGVFLTYTAEQTDFDISTFHFGGQAEVPLFAAPVGGGYLDPFISVGAGMYRSSQPVEGGGDRTFSDFALTPGAGTLIPIFGAIAIRGDVRDVIIFGDKTTNNFALEGGLSIGF